jgi:hypothetical protein
MWDFASTRDSEAQTRLGLEFSAVFGRRLRSCNTIVCALVGTYVYQDFAFLP